MKCQNPDCKKELKGLRRKFCSMKCDKRVYYLENTDKIKKKNNEWSKKNWDKRKKFNKEGLKKFKREKPERWKELMRDAYYREPNKWNSRTATHQILKSLRKIPKVDKFCKKCNSKKNLTLKFDVYPVKAKEIRKALETKKIYYICKECKNGNR